MQSFEFFNHFVPSGATLQSDNPVDIYLGHPKNSQAVNLHLPYFNAKTLDVTNHVQSLNTYSLMRTEEFLHHGLQAYTTILGGYLQYLTRTPVDKKLYNAYSDSRDRIFDSSSVQIVSDR